MKKFFILVFLFLLFNFTDAQIYRYVDKDGSVIITNDLNDIPLQHRSKVEIIKEEKSEVKDIKPVSPPPKTSITQTEQKTTPSAISETKALLSEKSPYRDFFNIAVPISMAIIFIFAHKILFFIDNKRVIALARFALVILFLIYLFNKHLNRMADSYLEAKKDIKNIQKTIETKDLKIDQLTK